MTTTRLARCAARLGRRSVALAIALLCCVTTVHAQHVRIGDQPDMPVGHSKPWQHSHPANGCTDVSLGSTFDAIQRVVFEGYGCSNEACHGVPSAPHFLDLSRGNAFDNLIGVPASLDPSYDRVVPGSPELSFLYLKLQAALPGEPPPPAGGSMPVGGALTADHLQAVHDWIRGGAPLYGVVDGTQELLETCLPDPSPLVIPEPDPPPPGVGVQLQQPPWPAGPQSKLEMCVPFFYDFTGTGLIPESARVPCPEHFQYRLGCIADAGIACTVDEQCADAGGRCIPVKNANNPSNECFAYNSLTYAQDPVIHHSFLYFYTGLFGPDHPDWGEWTYHGREVDDPQTGQPCDPLGVDPATGFNPGCGAEIEEAVACRDVGPPDMNNYGIIPNQGGNLQTLVFTQQPHYAPVFPASVYDVLPMRGIVAGVSHAFNLTDSDTTVSAYLNLEFAPPEDQENPVQPIFDSKSIFDMNVPPFGTQELCRTYTMPRNSFLFRLSSHNHRFGTRFRIWPPPNTPCRPECLDDVPCASPELPVCDGPRPDEEAIYESVLYDQPEQMFFDPPIPHNNAFDAARSYLYCSFYDNGSTPLSPSVKRRSLSEDPLGEVDVGGPCGDDTVVCYNEGPNRGMLCKGDDAVCDSSPGAGDGLCDACPVRGGVTLNDEMFVLIGDYYCDGECL